MILLLRQLKCLEKKRKADSGKDDTNFRHRRCSYQKLRQIAVFNECPELWKYLLTHLERLYILGRWREEVSSRRGGHAGGMGQHMVQLVSL